VSKVLKITSRLVLVLGLIALSFKPSVNNSSILKLVHPHHVAFSTFQSLSRRSPQSSHGTELRCNFQKAENKQRLPIAVVAVPLFDAFVFNAPRFTRETSSVFAVTASSPSRTVVLRI